MSDKLLAVYIVIGMFVAFSIGAVCYEFGRRDEQIRNLKSKIEESSPQKEKPD